MTKKPGEFSNWYNSGLRRDPAAICTELRPKLNGHKEQFYFLPESGLRNREQLIIPASLRQETLKGINNLDSGISSLH